MRTVARAEPSSVVTGLTDGNTTQMRADLIRVVSKRREKCVGIAYTQHDKPLWPLHSVVISLGITQALDVNLVGLLNLVGSSVSDENRLSSPLDDQVLALRDGGHVDFNLGQSQDIGGSSHVGQNVADGGLGSRSGEKTHRADHEVGQGSVGVGVLSHVRGEVWDIGGGPLDSPRGREGSMLEDTSGTGCTRKNKLTLRNISELLVRVSRRNRCDGNDDRRKSVNPDAFPLARCFPLHSHAAPPIIPSRNLIPPSSQPSVLDRFPHSPFTLVDCINAPRDPTHAGGVSFRGP